MNRQRTAALTRHVTNNGSDDVGVPGIDAATGALTHLGMNVGAESNPSSIAVDASGRLAYVTNYISNNISAYSINASTGAITAVGTAVPAEQAPISIVTSRHDPMIQTMTKPLLQRTEKLQRGTS